MTAIFSEGCTEVSTLGQLPVMCELREERELFLFVTPTTCWLLRRQSLQSLL